ncbi:unnamed protein product [Blepharisma stoltei]|uniref:non-specific serine/threonine protein kinase n=1 Tax=Blepharisma stoltei TaxID=1481888 RepID=A0AAU9JI75_9CILI|nr:unnamed protein product [Blepharisma stoltei]
MEGFKIIKLLGEGAFGKCYLCENNSDKSTCVIKQIDISRMSSQEKKEAYHEAKVMSAFDHPNIIRFRDVYTTTNGKLNIVMDHADGGDLATKIKEQRGRPFNENQILDWFVQICLAMKHVHDRKILHRDIKGQNIFLMKERNMIKLGDFGIAKVLNHTIDKARTQVGTPYYLSPEIIENRPYSFKSDVWSIGVLLYELCALRPPFDGNSIHQLSCNIVRGIYTPLSNNFSKDLKNLIGQMLSLDPNKRPNIAQILKMPFVRNRVQNFLSETIRKKEFSHTILHNQNVFVQKNEEALKKAREIPKEKPKEIKKEILERNRDLPYAREIPKNDYKYEIPQKIQEERQKNYEIPQKLQEEKPKLYEIPQRNPDPKGYEPKAYEVPKRNPDPKPYEIPVRNPDPKLFEIPQRNLDIQPKPFEIPARNEKKPEAKIPEIPAWKPKDKPPENKKNALPDIPPWKPQALAEIPPYKPPVPKAQSPLNKHLEDEFKPVQKQRNDPAGLGLIQWDKPEDKKQNNLKKKIDDMKIKMKEEQDKRDEEEAKKQAALKAKEEKHKKHSEERNEMRKDMERRKKEMKKKKKKKEDVVVEWLGNGSSRQLYTEEQDQDRMLHELQDIADGNIPDDIEDEIMPSIEEIEEEKDEDVVDRIDDLENQAVPPIEKIEIPVENNVVSITIESFPKFYDNKLTPAETLELLRGYLEEELGMESLMKTYQTQKTIEKRAQENLWSDEDPFEAAALQRGKSHDIGYKLVETLIFLEENIDKIQ